MALTLLTRATCLTTLVLLLAGCGHKADVKAWERDLLEADRAYDHEAWASAEAKYRVLAQRADARQHRYVGFQLARLAEERRDYPDALKAYKALWVDLHDDEVSANSLYRSALIWSGPLGRPDTGDEMLRRLMILLPDQYAAEKAMDRLLDELADRGDTAGVMRFTADHYKLLSRTRLADRLVYRRAGELWRIDARDEAVATLRFLIERHATSNLVDNSRWTLAKWLRERGDPTGSLTQLRFLAEDRDTSWIVGDYDSSYTNDARFQRGLIYLDDLHEHAAARDEFTTYISDFPESLRRDDARWNIVQTWLADDDGTSAVAECDALVKAEPESRYVRKCEDVVAKLAGGARPDSLVTGSVR